MTHILVGFHSYACVYLTSWRVLSISSFCLLSFLFLSCSCLQFFLFFTPLSSPPQLLQSSHNTFDTKDLQINKRSRKKFKNSLRCCVRLLSCWWNIVAELFTHHHPVIIWPHDPLVQMNSCLKIPSLWSYNCDVISARHNDLVSGAVHHEGAAFNLPSHIWGIYRKWGMHLIQFYLVSNSLTVYCTLAKRAVISYYWSASSHRKHWESTWVVSQVKVNHVLEVVLFPPDFVWRHLFWNDTVCKELGVKMSDTMAFSLIDKSIIYV